ncbi:MAG: LOG family protein [Alphaproteobacteria bacterium]|nr:LOG family protein [Alphaproteobacteria bacterium]
MKEQKTVKQMSVERGAYMRAPEKFQKSAPEIKRLADSFKKDNESKKLRIFVAGGSRSGDNPIYEKEAFLLGEQIAKMDFRLDFGLSGQGIMGAVAKGVLKIWAKQKKEESELPIKGITTTEYLALTQKDETVNQIKEVFVAHTLEERKNQLLNADFVIFAPGGIGTLDELVYDCVAMQDGFLPMKPFIIFNVNAHYYHVLEYLKEIHVKGFSAPTPFIVVDDAKEAGIVFEILKELYQKKTKKYDVFDFVEKLIYYMPFIFEKRKKNSKQPIRLLLDELEKNADNLKYAIQIEKAYLRKETHRMYERLERAGLDTASVSQKLIGLKQRKGSV